jgi:aspartate aminotransferase, cytoplasmic
LKFFSSNSIFKLTAAYQEDKFPQKVNLGVGAYRDDDSKPWVLPVVKKVTSLSKLFFFFTDILFFFTEARGIVLSDPELNYEYLPITGLPSYTSAAAALLFGKSSPVLNRVASVQTISGTGANHLGVLFLAKFYGWEGGKKEMGLPRPTWGEFAKALVVVFFFF